MTKKIEILSSYLPIKCGIASFTSDLYKSISNISSLSIDIIAVEHATNQKISNEPKRSNLEKKAYDYSQTQTWFHVGKQYKTI